MNLLKKNHQHPLHTSLVALAAAQMVAVRGSFLELLYLLSQWHVGRLFLHLSLVACRQVEGLGHGGTFHSLCLKLRPKTAVSLL